MKLEKIKKLKNGKYKLEFDNNEKIITYDDVVLKNSLLYQKKIDDDTIKNINDDHEYYDAYNKVLKYISIKMRSEKEIRLYLKEKNVLEFAELIVENLKKVGLINDKMFCKSFISDKMNLTNTGPIKIKEELITHNIEESIIEECMSAIDLEEVKGKMNKLINKKIVSNKKQSSYQLKQKIVLEMVNLGYARDSVVELINSIEIKEEDILEKEFNKLYNKLSSKLTGKELFYKIKQKLYQKGFDQNEISRLIQEKTID